MTRIQNNKEEQNPEMQNIDDKKLQEDLLKEVAIELDNIIYKKYGMKHGFTLFLFDFKNPEIANYISNVNKEDMIICFKEAVKRLEKE